MVILEVTLYTLNIELHFTKKHNSNDYVNVCEVSKSNVIDIDATQPQKGNSYHDRQTGRLFYLWHQNRHTIYFNDNLNVCREVPAIVHIITVRLQR